MNIPIERIKQTLIRLHRFKLFHDLDLRTLEAMIPKFHYKRWEKNESAMDSGDTKEWFYIILSGRIKISRIDLQTGKELTLSLLAGGDVFDIVCLLDGRDHDVLATTLDDVEVIYTANETIRQWLNDHPEFNRAMYPYMGEQMRYLENLATNITFHDTITRLARLILHYAHRYEATAEYKVKLINDLSHEELANMIGTVRSVVSRHLSLLHKEKTLEKNRKEMIIQDCEKILEHAKKNQSHSSCQ